MYYHRQLEKKIKQTASEYACITLYGARQTGKSTMIRNLFPDFEYVTLDKSNERILATDDPELFLDSHGIPLIIDEIQKVPELMEAIKIRIDEAKLKSLSEVTTAPLMYILTGSNTHEIREKASETLAGRTALVEVNSFSDCEKRKIEGGEFIPDIKSLQSKQKNLEPKNRHRIFEEIYLGGMPEYWIKRIDRDTFFESYIATYLEKDVSRMINVGRLDDFRKFMRIVALRTSQQLDYTEVGNAVGIDARTTKKWISILEASGIIMILQPYANNLSKRIIKTPKMYFMDTGLCAFLCGWSDPNILEDSAMAGAFFETYVVSEIIKSFYNSGIASEQYLYYYRDIDKKEVDILLVKEGCLYPVEIKKSVSPSKATKNFKVLTKYNMPIMRGMIIDNAETVRALNDDAFVFPVSLLGV